MTSPEDNSTINSPQTQGKKRDSDRPVGKAPAFQLYVKDFIADGKVLAMPLHCRGAYITLLCIDWNDNGIDENDFVALSGLDESDTKSIARVRERFKPHPSKPGYVTNQRLIEERENQAERRLKAQDAAGKRWHPKRTSKRNASALPRQCTPSASSPPSATAPSTTNNKRALSSADFVFPELLSRIECKTAIDRWAQHRRELKKPLTKTGIEAILKKYAGKPSDLIRDINHSMAQGWQGLYAPKVDAPKSFNPPPPSPAGRPPPKATAMPWERPDFIPETRPAAELKKIAGDK